MRSRNWKKGETMAESLVSILIVALATSMFLNFALVSFRMNGKARESMEEFHDSITALESFQADVYHESEVTVIMECGDTEIREVFPVVVYYDGQMVSYEGQAVDYEERE